MSSLPPIPTPLTQRWREFKIRVIPALVFVATAAVTAFLWKEHVAPPTTVGEVEMIQANVIAPEAGVLTNLWVARFQEVRQGDPIAAIIVTDPGASLQALRASIDLAQFEQNPASDRQRNAFDYHRLRLEHLDQVVRLATSRVNLRRAENTLERARKLFEEQLVSEDDYELAQREKEALEAEVAERGKLVTEIEAGLENLRTYAASRESDLEQSGIPQASRTNMDPYGEPIILRSPIDGFVSAIHHQRGENVIAGAPIVTLSSPNSERIVGYLRPPFSFEPAPGMSVRVRARTGDRAEATATILAVGAQMEPVSPALAKPALEWDIGLPVSVSLPSELALRPGELVDLTIRPPEG